MRDRPEHHPIDTVTSGEILAGDERALHVCEHYAAIYGGKPVRATRKPLSLRATLLLAFGAVPAGLFVEALWRGSIAAWLLFIAGAAAFALVQVARHEIARHAKG